MSSKSLSLAAAAATRLTASTRNGICSEFTRTEGALVPDGANGSTRNNSSEPYKVASLAKGKKVWSSTYCNNFIYCRCQRERSCWPSYT